MVTALTRVFGVHNLALAEDVVQDAICRALEVWKFRGVPENPAAWLMTAAKNRALDELRMMFSCCHPRLPEEVQVALMLQILCGFGTRELASAFLCSPAAMEKR